MRKTSVARWVFGTGALAVGLACAPAHADVTLKPLGRYATGVFDDGAAEIVAYDKTGKRLYVVNGADKTVDILDIADPTKPTKVGTLDVTKFGAGANSVYVKGDLVAVAIEAKPKQDAGVVGFFKLDGTPIKALPAGALPDMVGISPDGRYVLTANEGEPNKAFDNDPEGSITVVDLSKGVEATTAADVRTADFHSFEGKLPDGMRIGKPGATVSQDMEPEYIAFSADSKTAYVTLQENNGIAVVDLASAKVVELVGLGWKDHTKFPFDASDKDGGVNIKPWPVKGMYQPDTIASIDIGGATWLVIANEGDSRDYEGYSEETRVAKLKLDPTAFPTAAELQKPENLGRLKTTTSMGDPDGDGDFDAIYSYGARSFSVLDAKGRMVFDSGSQIEQTLAERMPKNFNANSDDAKLDDRSDDKGPEPEGVAVGHAFGTPYAFIGLERMGGVMIYDLTDPKAPKFVDYSTSRDFSGDPKKGTAGDLAPEGMLFIKAEDSPNGKPLLVTGNEVSGTTAIYEVVRK